MIRIVASIMFCFAALRWRGLPHVRTARLAWWIAPGCRAARADFLRVSPFPFWPPLL